MAINTQKLLPSAKGSPLEKIRTSIIKPTVSIKKKTIDTKKLIGPIKDQDQFGEDDPKSIQKTLMNIDSSLKLLLGEEQRKQVKKRKEKEKEDFEKEEKKLEAPKEAKKFNFPKLSLPGASFLDKIKRFLFFTALGWLFTKFQDQLPKLLGVVKIITQVYQVAENIFKFLLESVVNFIDRGYQAYDKVRDLAKSIGGEKAQQEFDNLSTNLNKYINYVLIGGMALTGAINSFAKEVKGKKGGKGGATAAGVGTGPKVAGRTPTGYRLDRGRFASKGFENVATPGQTKVAQYAPLKKGLLTKTNQASRIGAKKATQAVIGKQATKQLLRLAKGPLSRLPIIGGLVEFGLSWALGDPVGKAAFRGIGTLLLGSVGSLILPGFGTFVGGWAGAELAGKLYEVLFENKQPKSKVQTKQGGGSVTRGGKPQNAPTRSIKITRRKPPKIRPKQSQPGKDIGGKKKIKELYPDPSARIEIEGDQKSPWFNLLPPLPKNATPAQKEERDKKIKSLPNSYKALTGVAKKLKDIPFGIGALMGGAVDIALGEKLPRNAIQSLSGGISYLISSIANQQVSSSLSNIGREISKMATGGVVPQFKDFTKRDDLELEKDINKILGGLIQKKVDEAIREVQKQLMPAKYFEGTTAEDGPGGGPGGAGGGGGPAVESINVSGLSKEDVDALGRMIAAESAGENDLGKAGVLAVILNRYRLIKSGKATPGAFNIKGRTKDQVTIRDILFASSQFSPYANGSFARTSSSSGKSALAAAIRAGGNDPEKLRKNLIKSGLNEQDADYVVRSVAFSNARSRESRPFSTREVAVGRHSFQQSADVKLTGSIGRMEADVKESRLIVGPGAIKADKIYPLEKGQGRDVSSEPGIDFTYRGGQTLALYPGKVVDINQQFNERTGRGYGNYVLVESIDPNNGKRFTTLYAHFGNGKIKVREGDVIQAGAPIGSQPNKNKRGYFTGSGYGEHTSADFYESDGRTRYRNADKLITQVLDSFTGKTQGYPTEKPKPEQPKPEQSKSGQQAIDISRMSGSQIANTIRNIKPGQKIVFPGVGSIQGGKDWLGNPQTKYYDPQGNSLSEQQFTDRYSKSSRSSRSSRPTEPSRPAKPGPVPKPNLPGRFSGNTIEELKRRGVVQQRQGGGSINHSSLSSYPSYSDEGGMTLAIQPIIVEKVVPMHMRGNKTIMFPIPVSVNSNNMQSLSRG